jgi:hypothetical protein
MLYSHTCILDTTIEPLYIDLSTLRFTSPILCIPQPLRRSGPLDLEVCFDMIDEGIRATTFGCDFQFVDFGRQSDRSFPRFLLRVL